jgi:hypothetical protein
MKEVQTRPLTNEILWREQYLYSGTEDLRDVSGVVCFRSRGAPEK